MSIVTIAIILRELIFFNLFFETDRKSFDRLQHVTIYTDGVELIAFYDILDFCF